MLALVREGDITPSADAVAQRAGVGLRTVFRLFNDMDSLYREMNAAMHRRLAPLLETPLAATDWRDRLDELMERRRRVFEEVLPMKTAADAHRARSPFLRQEHDAMTRTQREMLLFVLPEAIRTDHERLEALDLAMSFETWRRLRHDQGLAPDAAAGVMRRLVAGLLG